MTNNNHVVCGEFGTIYYANILKNGKMSKNRQEITHEAINAVAEHGYSDSRYNHYGMLNIINGHTGNEKITLALFNPDRWELIEKK